MHVGSSAPLIPGQKPSAFNAAQEPAHGAPFMSALNQAKQDITVHITPADAAFQSQFKGKKVKISALEDMDIPAEDADSVAQTINTLSKKLEDLSKLEQKMLGL